MTVTKIICSKEKELAEMHTDIKWIRKSLEGNGVDGIQKGVQENTNYRIQSETRLKLLFGAIGSGWAVSIITLIFMIVR